MRNHAQKSEQRTQNLFLQSQICSNLLRFISIPLSKFSLPFHSLTFLYTILIFFTLLTPTTQVTTWQSITTGTQQIPAHVYLVTVSNASDYIRGICYWNEDADLDIYIYKQGDNYMTMSLYAARSASYSWDLTERFSYRPGFTGNFYVRVADYDLSTNLQYYLNITTTSQATIITTYTNFISPIKRFMAVTSITNMPQSSSYIPVMFTYSPVTPSTNLTRIDLQLVSGVQQRSLIANQISCLSNINSTTTPNTTVINQTWLLIFNHSTTVNINYINFYQYQLFYSTDSDFCDTYCENGYAWDNVTSQCVSQNNNNANSNDNDNNYEDQRKNRKSDNFGVIFYSVVFGSFGLILLFGGIGLLINRICQKSNAGVQPEEIHRQREVQSMSEINMLQKNICAVCLGENCSAILPCSHTFHHNCIQEWGKKKTQCPICRKKFLTKEIKVQKDVVLHEV